MGGRTTRSTRGEWDSYEATMRVYQILITDILGFNVTMPGYWGGANSFPRMDKGIVDVELENWQSAAGEIHGVNGYTGRVGLYVPNYTIDKYPQLELEFWRFFQNPEAIKVLFKAGEGPTYFNADGSYVCDGDPTLCVKGKYYPAWYTNETSQHFIEIICETELYSAYVYQRLIDGLHLNATLNFLGDRYFDYLKDALENKIDLVFYAWKPFGLVASHNVTRISFPDDANGEFSQFIKDRTMLLTVDVTTDVLFKTSSRKFVEEFPEAAELLDKLTLGEMDIKSILSDMFLNNLSDGEAACNWIKKNQNTWSKWIPSTPAREYSCPSGKGLFSNNALSVCLTCPASFYNWNPQNKESCQPCPAQGVCPGGDVVNVKRGYWLAPQNVSINYRPDFYDCPLLETCCPEEMITVELLFFYFQVIKLIFGNHLTEIIGGSGLAAFLDFASLNIDGLVTDCPAPLRDVKKLLFRFLLPFLCYAHLGIIYIIVKVVLSRIPNGEEKVQKFLPRYLQNQSINVIFVRSLSTIYTFTLMPLVEASIALTDCRSFLSNNVLFTVPNISCFSSQHVGGGAFAITVTIIVLVLVPLSIAGALFYLWRINKIVSRPEYRHEELTLFETMMEHFYMNYRPEFFFIEPFMIWERGVIVAIFAIVESKSYNAQANTYVVLFSSICLLRIYIQPYCYQAEAYLNREICLGFLTMLAINFSTYMSPTVNMKPLIAIVLFSPVVLHAIRWSMHKFKDDGGYETTAEDMSSPSKALPPGGGVVIKSSALGRSKSMTGKGSVGNLNKRGRGQSTKSEKAALRGNGDGFKVDSDRTIE
ncbi:hypothetical protein HDU76_008640 [Blyttiomyces sp. JEL0837]|nr:hypothetical protein HDU76_008640 [Blyttiomyces sp. JEL0837]